MYLVRLIRGLILGCVSEIAYKDQQCYAVCIEDDGQDDPELVIAVICKGRTSFFHIAAAWTNTNLENATAVCSEAILYRSKEEDANLFFAECDSRTDTVYFCLCDPSRLTFEDVSHYSVHSEAEQIAERLKTYVCLNAEVLC